MTMAVFGFLVITVGTASAYQDNFHTTGNVYHGWWQDWDPARAKYQFHGWTEHGHGSKYASIVHQGATHSHCSVIDDKDHVHCNAWVGSTHHQSGHKAPSGGGDCADYGDGHGICLHTMEALP